MGNYAGSYEDPYSSPGLVKDVGSWLTIDLNLTYDFAKSKVLPVPGLEASLYARNLLDKDPPLVDNVVGYDTSNADPIGRTISLTLRKRW